ncbi:LuxR C-terminal-related transcriptional regulator [Glaciibacter superstes]|uniref:LuxR C-terminal-related transcriptional regulator n=1 Tax=Glaciibacter superstes TaxID=501023 RepID=UPI0003B602BA|nr:LuxR C-terminal-related transcriptional regulator [Glaciibacter superstes]
MTVTAARRPAQLIEPVQSSGPARSSGPALDASDLRILTMVADGHQIDVVAQRLNLSSRTVRRRTKAMCDRFGARAPIQVAVWAARHGLI